MNEINWDGIIGWLIIAFVLVAFVAMILSAGCITLAKSAYTDLTATPEPTPTPIPIIPAPTPTPRQTPTHLSQSSKNPLILSSTENDQKVNGSSGIVPTS